MKVTLSEIKINLQGLNSGVDEAKNQINYWEHKEAKKYSITTARRKKNPKKSKNRVRSLCDNFKCTNSGITGLMEEEKDQEIENLFEKITKGNFPNLVKEIDTQVQEAQRVPNKTETKRTTRTRIILKCQILKTKYLKSSKRKADSLTGTSSHQFLQMGKEPI